MGQEGGCQWCQKCKGAQALTESYAGEYNGQTQEVESCCQFEGVKVEALSEELGGAVGGQTAGTRNRPIERIHRAALKVNVFIWVFIALGCPSRQMN